MVAFFAIPTGIEMGLGAALVAVALNTIAMITLARIVRNGQIGDLSSLISNGRAVAAIANFLLFNAVCAVSVAMLENGLETCPDGHQSSEKGAAQG